MPKKRTDTLPANSVIMVSPSCTYWATEPWLSPCRPNITLPICSPDDSDFIALAVFITSTLNIVEIRDIATSVENDERSDIGLDLAANSTHSLRRTKGTLIYR